MRREFFPDGGIVGLVQGGLHISLLFARVAAGVGAEQPGGGEPRGFIEPAGEQSFFAQPRRLARKDDEDGLRHVVRVAVVAGAAPRDGIDEVDVPPHEFGEGRLGIVAGKFPHQIHIVRVWHLMNYPRQSQKWTNYFEEYFLEVDLNERPPSSRSSP